MDKEKLTVKRKTLAGKVVRIFFKTVLTIILIIVSLALLLLTPPVQNFVSKKATAWLSNKLHTRVEIGKIYIGFPKKIVLENIYIEDTGKDTLLAGRILKVDVSMLKLLKSEIEINQVQLEGITAKVKRLLPDTIYNFQFIIDAFASDDSLQKKTTDTSAMKISVRDVELDKIRLVYDDDVTGNDMILWLEHFDTEIDEFDLNAMHFYVPQTNIHGIVARIYQHKPLVEPIDVTADSATAAPLPVIDFDFDKFELSNIVVDYGNDVSGFYTNLDLGTLVVKADNVDMKNQVIDLDKVQLDNTASSTKMGKKESAKIVGEEVKQETEQQAKSGWHIRVKNIDLNNNNLAFSNDNEPRLKQGMDYAHIDAKGVTLHAEDFIFYPDSIGGKITKGEMTEQSGFRLNKLQTDFLYSGNQAYLHNLLIETPGTILRRSVNIKYPSIEALQNDIGRMHMDLDINNSRVQVKDILTFAPMLASQPAFANTSETWELNGRITGSVANMQIQKLQLKAFGNTVVDVKGKIAGLPDPNKVSGDLVINKIQTTRKDILLLVPKNSIPSGLTLPESIALDGKVAGSMNDASGNLNLTTDIGKASVSGSIKNANDKKNAKYDAILVTRNVDLGVIMQNDSMYGPVTATISANGSGFDPKYAAAKVNATINSAIFNRYTYKEAKIHADLKDEKANFTFNINDPNINIDLNGSSDISGKFPTVTLNAVIDSINTLPLNFTSDMLVYKGTIAANFPNTDPDNLEGQLLITKSIIATKGERYPIDTMSLISGKSDTGEFLSIRSDVMSAELTGEYNLAQLGTVFKHSIDPYYSILPDSAKNDTLQNYDFRFKANLVNGPLIQILVPTLTKLDPVKMEAHFATGKGWITTIDAPLIIMGANHIQKFSLRAGTDENSINLKTGIEKFSSGTQMNIYATSLDADIADNKINFLINLKDEDNKNKYRFGGLFEQPQQNLYALRLYPDSLLLDYDKWNISDSNMVRLNDGDVNIRALNISREKQLLSVNSQSTAVNAPIDIKLNDFRIQTLTAIAKQDSVLVDGIISGEATLKDIATQLTFTSDINITDLMFHADTIGNLNLKVNNTTSNVYAADVTLTGKGNNIVINGSYSIKPENEGVFDLKAEIKQLQMTSVQSFSMGAITNASGFISGAFDISGTFEKPLVNGELGFNKVAFTPEMLGSYLRLSEDKIKFDNAGIHFNSFSVLDSSKNELTINGDMLTENYVNYTFNLDLKAKNFEALNSKRERGRLFYGTFYFDTDLRITGTEESPDVNGRITVNEKTKFTAILPQSDPGVEEREGIVRFIDMDSVRMDTTVLLAQADSLNKSRFKGMDISVNIEVNKNAELTLIIDEGNGDFLKMRGTAQLTGGIDPSGKTTLTGTYEIEEGSYQISVNLLQRKFEIEKGSRITWLGEPTRADVDVTAVYVTKTAPITLVENQMPTDKELNKYKQKLPFHVQLMLSGELMKPDIKFDIVLPEDANLKVDASVINNVDTRLTQLRNEPNELNKQVFALLLLNRFVSENPFESSGSGGGVESMARASVSKLLSEQLNSIAADLITGVEVNFDMESSEDYTTGEMQNRTDLNVSLSKRLLSDRLKITVGSNFELEGPQQANSRSSFIAENVALDYMLSKDGRYMLRAYRKNEYEGELEGYIIETGLNFILSFDYDHFHDLFRKKKKPVKNGTPSASDNRKAVNEAGSGSN